MNIKQFIQKANEIHNNFYDYSLVHYINSSTKIKIICPKHGIFEQRPTNHTRPNKPCGCPKCGAQKGINGITYNTKDFINKAIQIHGDKYNYSLVEYTGSKTKVKIICPEHGVFVQVPSYHISGKGCLKCAQHKNILMGKVLSSKAAKEFVEKSKLVHGDKYDYSLVNYTDFKTKVKIICPKHGIFEQTPNKHKSKRGCPVCRESRGEKLIANWLTQNNIKFIREKRIKEFNPRKPFDFYLLDYDLYIEYDGIQHFIKGISSWGKKFEERRQSDLKRNNWCQENNINLLIISYLENPEEILSERLFQSVYNKNQLI